MLQKNRFYSELEYSVIEAAHQSMTQELEMLPLSHPLHSLFEAAWKAFRGDQFSYDGATFVRERYLETIFEVAAFIHDWRNSTGYVGKAIDREMFDIMITLRYDFSLIIERFFYTRFTGVNVLRHRLKRTYVKILPENLYSLRNSKINIS